MAQRARLGFAMRVLFHDPSPAGDTFAQTIGAQRSASVDALLAASDVVSLHCPASPETHHLIDARRLAMLRPTAVLINTARGDVVDERALVDALRAGRLRGAGLDVYEHEPAVPAELRAMENVVLLPHLGSATAETREAMGMRAVDNLEDFFAGRPPRDRVA